ncbi:hypothetical protein [Thermococcus sp. JCM 11816]|uniref:hypothetical protein n=1 Tax=Thermococcus sp. (strain JCM 11816 / KS-1) TaxID=1295125 RepID=UPI0006D0673C
MDVKIIKRTTYFWGLYGKEEEIFSGDIWNKNVNIDDIGKILGKWTLQLGNMVRFELFRWEIKKALGDIQFPPNSYEFRDRDLRDLAYSSEDFRGFNPPILQPSGRGLFKLQLIGQASSALTRKRALEGGPEQ